jgi:ribosomal protein S16
MTAALATAQPSGNLYRVGRGADAWAWPPWSYAGEDGTFGNRFDDPAGEYRVLYASSPRLGAFLETLARYRPDPALVAEHEEIAIEPDDTDRYPTIPPGVVPADCCSSRAIGTARHDGPFADIGQSSSLAELRAALASRLVHYGRRREVTAMLALLPERHREVLVRRYGLDHRRAQSYEEIGEWLGVGAERGRQLEREALYRLRSIAGISRRAA